MRRDQAWLAGMETPGSVTKPWGKASSRRERALQSPTLWRDSRWRLWATARAAPCTPGSAPASPWPRRTCARSPRPATSATGTGGRGWSCRTAARGELFVTLSKMSFITLFLWWLLVTLKKSWLLLNCCCWKNEPIYIYLSSCQGLWAGWGQLLQHRL